MHGTQTKLVLLGSSVAIYKNKKKYKTQKHRNNGVKGLAKSIY
jgi:hypothetical protein